ncbi:MAG: outer membrane protein assembly factor BamE [Gammaproteobacteria bacterium]|nr:outer membrane protein assembly factor BamE [Gammaproteobacteria bacterium]
MRAYRLGILFTALLLLSSCLHPYSPEVQQGNIVTQEMLDKLKPGMTKNQVRYVLGTPLINDPFHQNRWDYVYRFQKEMGAPAEQRRLAAIFENDALLRWEGEALKPADIAGSAESSNTQQPSL